MASVYIAAPGRHTLSIIHLVSIVRISEDSISKTPKNLLITHIKSEHSA